MYKAIKKVLRKIIPKNILYKYEPQIRFLIYQLYKGNNFRCNICNKELRKFIPYQEDELCPNCGSLARTRRLWAILQAEFLKEKTRALDFSPSRSLYRVLKKISCINYSGTDLSGDFLSDYRYDITHIAAQNEIYDVIICYHILEHIENDSVAMKELWRVTKNGGSCIIQTPFKEGEIYEDKSIKSPKERLEHFGQSDHIRIYSVNGLKQRLMDVGFTVEVREYNEKIGNRCGFNTNEIVLICTK
jgi:SAM-dependent methyltransferase